MPASAAKHGIRATKIQTLNTQCTGNSRHADYGPPLDESLLPPIRGCRRSRVLISWKEEVCLAARASIPRVLQLSVRRRSRGEAVGGIQQLIGTPERFFYTGKPPTVLGGLYPLLVLIHPSLSLAGGLAFPPQILYSTPLGYMSRKKRSNLPKL